MAGPEKKQEPSATDKTHTFKVKQKFIKVSVRTDFTRRDKDGKWLRFDLSADENISHVTVEIRGAGIKETTSASGIAKLEVTALADGDYVIALYMANSAEAATAVAGPDTVKGVATPPKRMFMGVDIHVSIKDGKLTAVTNPYDPEHGVTHGMIGNRNQHDWSADHLPVDYRPSWWQTPREKGSRPGTDLNLIVCHCTGGDVIGHDINTFIPPGVEAAHYLVDHDGHIIKFARETQLIYHVGCSNASQTHCAIWDGVENVNNESIGIEIVHRTQEHASEPAEIPYADLQMKAVLGLLQKLQGSSDFRIPKHRIIGHSDADLTQSRDADPGQNFPWEKIEAAGLGMIPQAGQTLVGAYGGFFDEHPNGTLGPDPEPKVVPHSKTPPPVRKLWKDGIQEMQRDLTAIGYTTPVTGIIDSRTIYQTQKIQRHFFSVSRKRSAPGKVDSDTAVMIKSVLAGVPGAAAASAAAAGPPAAGAPAAGAPAGGH